MLLVILAIYFGYKKGKASGRSGPLWAVISGAVFLGVQFATAIAIATIMLVGASQWGWSPNMYDNSQILVSLISLVPAVIAIWAIYKYLDRLPDDGVAAPPPPPPTFVPPTE